MQLSADEIIVLSIALHNIFLMDDLNIFVDDPENPKFAESLAENYVRLLNEWEYAAGTSNLAKLASISNLIVKVLRATIPIPSLASLAVKIGQKIISDHLKVVYRSLFLTKESQTVSAIEILENLTKIAKGTLADSLYNNFDFTLAVIPKLLASRIFRVPFLQFYSSLLESVSIAARKDLMYQKNIVRPWITRLHEDEYNTVELTFRLFEKCVLKCKLFTKSQKISFFNDYTLQALVKLLSRQRDVAEVAERFFMDLFCSEDGVKFANARWYSQEPNNKLTLSFLQMVKPWENSIQAELTLALLKRFSELVYPYFERMHKTYPFTPKTSMFWYNYAVLHLKVIDIEIPELELQPPTPIVIANILPQSLTKSQLYNAITFKENQLVPYMASQIILAALKKLEKLLGLYKRKVWDPSPLLIELADRIPSVHVLSAPMSPQLLEIVLLKSVVLYYKIFGTANSRVLPQSLTDSFKQSNLQGLDLIEAQSILEIQTAIVGPTKWYNKMGDSQSFFTKLLRFAVNNPGMASSSADLLKYLVDSSLVFQTDTLCHPVDALLYSLEVIKPRLSQEQETKLWNLIDESVSRAARVPYGYIDESPHSSPFAVAVVQQYEFVDKSSEYDIVELWKDSFLRDLGIIGEHSLYNGHAVNLSQEDYFEYVLEASAKAILRRRDISFKIESPLELMATIYRAVSTPELGVYLLENIPSNMAGCLKHRSCFELILRSANDSTIECFIRILLYEDVRSDELSEALSLCKFWYMALPLLSTEILISKISEHSDNVFKELARRRVSLPLSILRQHLNEYLYIESISLTKAEARELCQCTSDPRAIAAIIAASGYYEDSLGSDRTILLAAFSHAETSVTQKTRKMAVSVGLASRDIELLSYIADDLSDSEKQDISDFLNSCRNDQMQSAYAKIVRFIPTPKEWVKNVILNLTKCLSESLSIPHGFLGPFSEFLDRVNIWDICDPSALIEIVIKTLDRTNAEILELLNHLIFSIPAGASHSRFLQSLLDQDVHEENKLLFNLAIWRLYSIDARKNSTSVVRNRLLLHYGGSNNSADSLLFLVLKQIESESGDSWIDDVLFWELRARSSLEYDAPNLVTLLENKLQISIDEVRVENTVKDYDPVEFELPKFENFSQLSNMLEKFDIAHPCDGYSSELLLLLLASCEELVKDEYLNVKLLSDLNFLPLVICSLCNRKEIVVKIAVQILEAVSVSLSSETQKFKESIALSLVVNKLLMAIQNQDRLAPHIAIMTAEICKISVKPGHTLHEKVADWLLAGPSIQPFELPMWGPVINSTSTFKHQEVLWLLHSLRAALADRETVNIYLKHGVFEWAFNQLSLMSSNTHNLANLVKKLFTKAEFIGGSPTLIKRMGALSVIPSKTLVTTVPYESITSWMGYNKIFIE